MKMYYNVGGNSYWVEIYGDGKPLVMLHGFTGSTNTWHSVKDSLIDNYQVILVDLPGHGRTNACVDSIEACCADLASIFDQMRLSAIHLLGYSMGGRTAISFAILYPQYVESLLLESTTAGIANEAERENRVREDHKLAAFILENPLEVFVDKWEKVPLFESQRSLPEHVRKKIRQERLSQTKEGLAHSLQVMGTGSMPSWWEYLQQVTCDVCIIVGEEDNKFVQIGKKMNQTLANSELQMVKKSGHAIHVEQTNIFGTIVNEFISRRRTTDVN
ncbi:2-succinyl-6-hydroxy-2,4-cyclohexadiene-1-carboxylate synthase [Gracilibacillus xinjiangensis]|uniref:Putative 2-succinyl-6-hydroxy-2,4-cyclohexadiene-1-carboxylate synthase n=1 Tax=Gracilibacillus xinjiangensis TaxID=1193282 RepID=A0ABV8WY42_9BACI